MSSPPKDTRILSKFSQQGNQAIFYSSEARFLIDTFQKKSACVCSTNLGFSLEKIVLVLVWGTYYVPHTYVVCTWYQRALRCQLRGRPFHPWAGRLLFSGEAHPGPATLTQSSSFSCGAGLQSESRLLLCCAPVTRDHATHVYSSVHACC